MADVQTIIRASECKTLSCRRTAASGRTRCQYCLDRATRLRDKRSTAGLCTGCGRKSDLRIRCRKCLTAAKAAQGRRAVAKLCKRCAVPVSELLRYCAKCRAAASAQMQRRKTRAKQTVFDHYGWACSCCGESEPLFLTIDHINNDGWLQRKGNTQSSSTSYIRLANAVESGNAPTDLRTLCYNCNCARARNGGVCPHEQMKAAAA